MPYVSRYSPSYNTLLTLLSQACDGSFTFLCASYTDIIENNVPAVYNNETGILKQNVDTMLDAIYKPFHDLGNCKRTTPKGPAGV
jgi:hypothetical protein